MASGAAASSGGYVAAAADADAAASGASAAVSEAMPLAAEPRLRVVVFSKDRPSQLYTCLVTLLRCARGLDVDVRVICAAGSFFRASYLRVAELLGPSVRLLFEGSPEEAGEDDKAASSFAELLRESLAGEGPVLLTVDDALWLRGFDARAAWRLLETSPEVLTVHLKLAPGMSYAQPPDLLMRHPPLSAAAGHRHAASPLELLESLGGELVTFRREKGEADWNYPWDLSGSIYRLCDARAVYEAVEKSFGITGVAHPNVFEGHGQRLLKEGKVEMPVPRPSCACLSEPAVVVVTINRVQSKFLNPLMGEERSVEELEEEFRVFLAKNFEAGVAHQLPLKPLLDVEPYLVNVASVHQALRQGGGAMPDAPDDACKLGAAARETVPAVSWLVPVFNAADTLNDALASLASASEAAGCSWEAVLVDDCSDDGSAELLAAAAGAEPRLRVLTRSSRGGVAAALNDGLGLCRGDVVFRLDADDLACRCRVSAQLAFLRDRPEVAIVGGSIRTFAPSSSGFQLNRTFYPFPVESNRVRWEMLFGCPLAHPAVAMRRSLVEDFGPRLYPEGVEAEDHACWLRLARRGVQFANVPDTVTLIRRHPGSRSAQHARALKISSQSEVARFLAELNAERGKSNEAVLPEDVAALWGDKLPKTREDAERAVRVLEAALECIPASPGAERRFCEDDCRRRKAALTCSCLASGDVDVGSALIQGLLASKTAGGAAPKSLGELLGAGLR
eukprot:TRINITY_DN29221_c0_g1_i1.p1 TRINITY_DN29221_c0_g1~~TRINITY_DN29221_c0_g1_i1.p1  ORF type:complete len:744 (-),score=167.83 TRINITY_DN29221_c0_g1_i1:17-2218(-)